MLVLAQANPDAGQYDDIFPRYQRWFNWFGFDKVYLLRAVGVKNPGEIQQQTALLDQAASLARDLVK